MYKDILFEVLKSLANKDGDMANKLLTNYLTEKSKLLINEEMQDVIEPSEDLTKVQFKFLIINSDTLKVVGQAKTKKTARMSKNKNDNEYGAYVHRIKAQHPVTKKLYNDLYFDNDGFLRPGYQNDPNIMKGDL